MSIRDQSRFYSAGAQAMKRLADRCGHGRLARIFEDQVERYLRMAEASARSASEPDSATCVVPARRPRAAQRLIQGPRTGQPRVSPAPERREANHGDA